MSARIACGAPDAFGAYLAQHDYCLVKVDNNGHNAEFVRASINGKLVSLIIDTGASDTVLTAACARHLGLDVHETSKIVGGVGGKLAKGTTGIALINSFKLGGLEINRTNTIDVLPKSSPYDHSDGLLGFDYLKLNAALLPVGGRFLLVKPGTRSIPEFADYLERGGYKPIPLSYEGGAPRIDGSLNGHSMIAVVDCGAEYSTFDLHFVRQVAGISTQRLGLHMQGIDGRPLESFAFVPKRLALDKLLPAPIALQAVASPMFAEEKFDALLGFDLLGTHDAMLDLGHDVLWMK